MGDPRRHLSGSGEMEQDGKDPTRGLPREPNHAGDLRETAWNWVKKRVKRAVHQFSNCGVKAGAEEEGLLIPHPHVHGQRKPQCPEKPLCKDTHVLAVGNWAGMPWKGQVTETQAGQQLQLQYGPINSIKLNEGTGISERPVSLGPSNNTAPS